MFGNTTTQEATGASVTTAASLSLDSTAAPVTDSNNGPEQAAPAGVLTCIVSENSIVPTLLGQPDQQTQVLDQVPIALPQQPVIGDSSAASANSQPAVGTMHGEAPPPTAAPAGTTVENENSTPSSTEASHLPPTAFRRVILTDWVTHPGAGDMVVAKAEILEFSWAVYDIINECILEKSRQLLRPTENDRSHIPASFLSLLHLPNSKPLEHAKTLSQVLVEFDNACSMVAAPSICVISSADKLRSELLTEACRKALRVPKCLRSVLDLGTLARHFYPSRVAASAAAVACSGTAAGSTNSIPRIIAESLQLSMSPPKAEEFSSVDGCLVLAEIVKKLHSDKIYFQPQHLSTVVVPDPVEGVIGEGLPAGEVGSSGASSPAGSDAKKTASTAAGKTSGGGSSDNQGDCLIRLRGVPWDTSISDIIAFIEPVTPIAPDDVQLVTNSQGKITGEVLVQVPSTKLRDQCLQQLHGQYMGRRWIEVFKASVNDFVTFSRLSKGGSGRGAALRLRGLPWSTNEYEVVKFFAEGGFEVEVNSVILGHNSQDHRLNGEAWVMVDSTEVAEKALRTLHKKALGRRYVEVFLATPQEAEFARKGFPMSSPGRAMMPYSPMRRGENHLDSYRNASFPYGGAGGAAMTSDAGRPTGGGYYGSTGSAPGAPGAMVARPCGPLVLGAGGGMPPPANYGSEDPPTSVVRLRGLPYSATEQQIVDFFRGFEMVAILPATAPINGRPSGEAYVQFASHMEALRAVQCLHQRMMDRRYIELFFASKQEMDMAASGMDPREIRAKRMRLRG